ncbi:MAG: YeeE/YedE family protein [Actinobacteria bacterium]|nr:YeeE/YedE family protein [Actinomycetota bacterium]
MTRLVATIFGAGFGFVLAWAQLTDPERIRQMLLLEDAHYYLMMATAFAVGTLGTRLLRARRARTLVTGELVTVEHTALERRHVTGSILFGLGWAVTNACPGPIAAQLGQGLWWGLLTLAGFLVGARLQSDLARRANLRPGLSGGL